MSHMDPDKHPNYNSRQLAEMKPCGIDFRRPALGCLPARSARLWLEISDDRGQEATYSVTPLKFTPPQAMAKAYTLTQCRGARTGASYQCTLDHEGQLACTCPGFTHAKHCKHIDALKAAALLSPSDRLEIRRLQRECESRVEVIRKGLPCGEPTLCPDDVVRPCILPQGHEGFHDGEPKRHTRAAKRNHARRLREEAEAAVPMQPTLQPA